MKNVFKKKRFLNLLLVLMLFAGLGIIFSTCKKDEDECKECTNKITKETKTYCGDELAEAELNPTLTCK